jgi:hypothetical protein
VPDEQAPVRTIFVMTKAAPLVRTVKFVAIIATVALIGQVALNPPHRRAEVLCWPVYKLAQFILVGGTKTLLHTEHHLHIQAIYWTEKGHAESIAFLEKHVPGFSSEKPIDLSLPRFQPPSAP